MGACLSDPFIGEMGDVDTAIMSIRLRGGGLCQIDNTRRARYGYDERIEVLGANGLIESGRAPRVSVSRTIGTNFVSAGIHQDIFERFGKSYANSIGAFARFLSDSREPVPTLADGLAAQNLAEAATISGRENRIVSLSEIDEL
jgi:myo-inositol 2-dehydrogenase/D-chiro-inositol 1-dehydrogenase